jgi:hypothetical protein
LDGEAEPNDEAEDREGNQGQRDPSCRGIGAGESGLALGLTTRSSAPGRPAEQSSRAPAAYGRLLEGERTSAADERPTGICIGSAGYRCVTSAPCLPR